jgi:L-asparaginase
MPRLCTVLFSLAFYFVSVSGLAMANITILATGGTIAGSGDSATKGEYTSGEISVDELIKAVPDLDKLGHITGEQISNIGSQDMSKAIWLKLAKRVNELLAKPDCDAIVITHGTDTMEETAYFLNLTVHSRKPVILVGSMRPATALSSDGPANLYDAVTIAASHVAQARGVLVAMSGHIFSARDVVKSHTTNVDSFSAPGSGPIGQVQHGHVEFSEKTLKRHTFQSEFNVDTLNELPQVEIIYGYADASPITVQALSEADIAGIVHNGLGNGNIPSSTMDALAHAQRKGIQVVRTSRACEGPTTPNAEVNDSKYHFVASGSLNAAKARILLMLALTKTHDPKQIQALFNTY